MRPDESAGQPGRPGKPGGYGVGGAGGVGGEGGAGQVTGGTGGMGGTGGEALDARRTRRADRWRLVAVAGALLACLSILLTALLYVQVQDERARNIFNNCRETNDRHVNTVRELDGIYEDRLRTANPAERARLKQGRDSTVLLIKAFLPIRDCRALVGRQVDGSTP